MPISTRKRFEIFKRDSFKCKYCGKSAPDVILHIDHIEPVSSGGTNHPLNLVTACRSCNLGKSNIPLTDMAELELQKQQLADLNERQKQLDMLLKWRSDLLHVVDKELDACHRLWQKNAIGWSWNENGKRSIKNLIKKYGVSIVLESIEEAAKYIRYKEDKATSESVDFASDKLKGICYIKSLPEKKRKEYWEIGKIKKGLQYRFRDYDPKWTAIKINKFMQDHDISELKALIEECESCGEISNAIDSYYS